MNRTLPRCLSALVTLLGSLPALAQDPAPGKGPDKEIAEKIETLKDVVLDKKFARDNEGVQIIDWLLEKTKAGVDEKDQQAIVKALDGVFTAGPKVRPPREARALQRSRRSARLLRRRGGQGAEERLPQQALPRAEGVAAAARAAAQVPRAHQGRVAGEVPDQGGANNHEAALQAAAGEALGNFDESKEPIRKEIVGELMVTYGELSEKAGQLGSQNIEAQNAQDPASPR
jgi:hypothetical protein